MGDFRAPARIDSRYFAASAPDTTTSPFVVVCLLLMSVPIPTVQSLTVGSLLVLLLAPVLLTSPVSLRLARLQVGLLAVLLGSGLLLAALSVAWHAGRTFDLAVAVPEALVAANLVANVIVVVWGTARLGLGATLCVRSVSAALAAFAMPPQNFADLWKYSAAWPLSLLVLVCLRQRRLWQQALVSFGLSAISLALDTRNTAGALALVGFMTLLKAALPGAMSRVKAWTVMVSSIVIGSGIVSATSALSSAGVFGQELQARVSSQVRTFGLLGGRLEYGATFGLFKASPQGLGLGVLPSTADVRAATDGLIAIKAPVLSDYFRNDVLGRVIEVHSIAGDVWLEFGFAGIGAVLAGSAILVAGAYRVLRTDAPLLAAAILFVIAQAMWDTGFSPLNSNNAQYGVAIGAGLVLLGSVSETAGKLTKERT